MRVQNLAVIKVLKTKFYSQNFNSAIEENTDNEKRDNTWGFSLKPLS